MPRSLPTLARWFPALLLAGCGEVDYQPVSLQLDVLGALPEDASTLHLCVTGAGEHDQGAGNGRAVFTGLPVADTEVEFDVLDGVGNVIASAGPVTFADGDSYAETPLEEGGEACKDRGKIVKEGEESQSLAVRVVEL